MVPNSKQTGCSDKAQITERSRHKKRETLFRDILFSYPILKETQVKKIVTAFHKLTGFSGHLGGTGSDKKPPSGFHPSCHVPFLQGLEKHQRHLICPRGTKAEQAIHSYCTILQIIIFPQYLHHRNCRTLSKTWQLSGYDRLRFCSSSWGPSQQAFTTVKHSLFFHVIIY